VSTHEPSSRQQPVGQLLAVHWQLPTTHSCPAGQAGVHEIDPDEPHATNVSAAATSNAAAKARAIRHLRRASYCASGRSKLKIF
jgi:hypothetical protein